MADNTKQTYTLAFKVDVGNAKQNLRDYKDYVDGLKGALLGLEKGTDEYKNVATELKTAQEKLNEVMDVAKGKGESVAGSYDALSKEMSRLKKEWKATGDEAERAKLGQQIVEINDKLKTMDASVGVFSRNVGNYQNAFENAFASLKDGLTSSVPAVKKLNSAFNLIVANPVGAVITAIAVAITAVVKAMKSSESQFNQFKVATAGIKVVIDGVKNALTSVSQVFVNLIEKVNTLAIGLLKRLKDGFRSLGWDKWADGMETFLSKIEDYQQLEQKEIDIEQRRRQIAVEAAKAQNEVNELRAKINEKDKYSVEQRLKFVEQWENAEKRRAQLSVDLAQAEYDAIKKRNSLTETSTKDLDAENDAYVKLIEAQGQFNESLRTINKTRSTLLSQVNGESGGGAETPVIQSYNEIINALAEAEKREEEIRQEGIRKQEELNAFSAELDRELYEALQEELDEYNDEYIQSLLDAQEKEKQILNERKTFIKNFVSATSTIIGAVADAWETSIKSQIETGKISEKEGEKQFEQVKALQTAVSIINTIAGAVGAFMGITKDTGGWGIAAAAAQAAAVMVAGMAQVSKIQSTTLGTRNTQVTSVGTPNLGSIVNEYQPQYTQNITNATETEQLANALRANPIQAYVVESSVTAKQELARQRESETTY